MRLEIPAKYPGRCRTCGAGIDQGSPIVWIREGERKGRGSAYHPTCAPPEGADTGMAITLGEAGEAGTVTVAQGPDAVTTVTAAAQPDLSSNGAAGDAIDPLVAEVRRRLLARGFTGTAGEAVTTVSHTVTIQRPDAAATVVTDAHPQFATLATMADCAPRCVYLHGSPGAGKSYAARKVATSRTLPYRYVSLSPQSMPTLLFGYMDAQGRYVSTAFRQAYERGGVICIDEVDNANANLLASLNGALANGRAEFPDGMVDRHPDCIVIATGNTAGFGPTLAFPERRPLDRAFRDRFTFLAWQYAPAHEKAIARSLTANRALADAWTSYIHAVRTYAAKAYPALTCSPRSIYAGIPLLARGLAPAEVAESTLFQGIEAGVIAKITAACPLPTVTVGA